MGPLYKELLEQIDAMPAQLQIAARFVLDRPDDVALLSMRDQAKRAGVAPATMTRLAKRMGFSGYEDIRSLYAESVRRGADGFSDRAGILVDRHRARGETAVAVDVLETVSHQLETLRKPETLDGMLKISKLLIAARRICVLGQRSSYPVAYQFAYLCSLIGCDARLLDGPGAIGADHLHDARPGDALVVVSIRPYSTESMKIAKYALHKGLAIVAITDSIRSPFASLSTRAVVVGVESPSFFHTMVPAFLMVEAIAALVAADKGDAAQRALTDRERHFEALNVMLMLRPVPKE